MHSLECVQNTQSPEAAQHTGKYTTVLAPISAGGGGGVGAGHADTGRGEGGSCII